MSNVILVPINLGPYGKHLEIRDRVNVAEVIGLQLLFCQKSCRTEKEEQRTKEIGDSGGFIDNPFLDLEYRNAIDLSERLIISPEGNASTWSPPFANGSASRRMRLSAS
jgi:hypothetical protein